MANDCYLHNCHSVGGKGASLVWADGGGITHRLASIQMSHQIIVCHHFLKKRDSLWINEERIKLRKIREDLNFKASIISKKGPGKFWSKSRSNTSRVFEDCRVDIKTKPSSRRPSVQKFTPQPRFFQGFLRFFFRGWRSRDWDFWCRDQVLTLSEMTW